jgi:tetratricopeptide (TPR) repeat protein
MKRNYGRRLNACEGEEMSIQPALEKLKPFTCNVPAEALETVRKNWSEAEPLLLAELDWQIQNPLEEDRSALFLYALYLCAEMKCEATFDRYVSILRMPTALLDAILGDMLTEAMPEMLTRTCAGRVEALKALVEDETVYEFARGAALDALRNLMLDGALSRDELAAYCSQLLTGKLEKEPSHIWDITASLAEILHMTEALPAVEAAYQGGLTDPGYQSLDSVRDGLLTQSADDAMACARRERRSFSTVETEMNFFVKQWPANGVFPEKDDRELLAEPREVHKRSRRVVKKGPGRNDPCPCGSGKKYKKCCINLGFDPDDAALEVIPEPLSPADDWMGAGYYYRDKRYFGSALTCWRNCWREVLKVLPSGLSDPQDDRLEGLFSACDFFSNWLQDYQMLLEERSGMDIQALRDGLQFCREALKRFPAMDDLMRGNFEQTRAMLLIRSGRHAEGLSLLEEMIRRKPESAQGYVLLADMLSWEVRHLNLRPDWNRAEQLLRQAQMTAKNCKDWDVDVRLEDLKKKLSKRM